MILTTAPKISAVPTACDVGMPSSRIRRGVVIVPAPTPVNPMKVAMTNPSTMAMKG